MKTWIRYHSVDVHLVHVDIDILTVCIVTCAAQRAASAAAEPLLSAARSISYAAAAAAVHGLRQS